jgi:hypothetical protein
MLLLLLLFVVGGAMLALLADSLWMLGLGATMFVIGAAGLARLVAFVVERLVALRRERAWLRSAVSRG